MPLTWHTKLIHSDASVPPGFRSLVTPVYRGSTTVFPNAAAVHDDWRHEAGYTYGLYGTPTTRELAARIAELEHGEWTFITPGGQAAIALIDFAFLGAGDHVLIPDSAYGPNRQLADTVLRRFGVDVEYYPPLAGAELQAQMRPTTRVDVTMQALTKYIGGHSDLLLGSVTVRAAAEYERLGPVHDLLGLAVSPDDCSLALRGMQTLGVRLAALERESAEGPDRGTEAPA